MTLNDIRTAHEIILHQSFNVFYEIAAHQSRGECVICGRRLSLCSSAGATVDGQKVCCYCIHEALSWTQIQERRHAQETQETGLTYQALKTLYIT